jgi:molybdenum-dependent DNA-binding transcriptional regulator ModE
MKSCKRVCVSVKVKPCFKLWLETEDGYVFGQGSFELLHGIQEKGTLKRAR